jgi:hypothetical protein
VTKEFMKGNLQRIEKVRIKEWKRSREVLAVERLSDPDVGV